MELSQLRYFLDAAETEHFTKSAERLHIAQPSLTKTIHNLEEELGVPLFIHKGRGIILSDYGKFLKEHMAPIMAELDSLPEAVRKLSKAKNETVHLNVLAASSFLTDIIVEYKKQNPDVRFEFLQNEKADIYDIRITTKPAFKTVLSTDETFVFREKILVAVPLNKKYENRHRITPGELEEERFISLSSTRQFRSICDGICRSMGFKPNIIFESDSPIAVQNMISANTGVGFWPEFTWGDIRSDKIMLLPIEGADCTRDIIFTVNNKDNTSSLDFFNFIKLYCGRINEKEL